MHASVRARRPRAGVHPQHARALARKARMGLWPLFLRRTLMLRSCRPRHHGLAVGVCFAHAVAEKGAPSFWSASAHLATSRRFNTHAFVPDCGFLDHRHPWRPPELCRGLHRAYLRPMSGLSPSRSPLRARAPKRTPAHASLRASSLERTLDHLPRTASAPTPPCPHRRRPRRVGHLLS
jgi:hypothetical protein